MNKTIAALLSATLLGIIVYTFTANDSGKTDQAYTSNIQQQRQETEKYFRSANSPLTPEDKEAFNGLHYYVPDASYRVTADVEWIAYRKVRKVNTSRGNTQRYLEKAFVSFSLHGQDYRTLLLQDERARGVAARTLVLPFTDETSGKDTYGGGRYLNVILKGNEKTVEIDFNQSYNPYCAYNPAYDCVIPPSENHIDVPVAAGEKKYKP